MHDVNVPGLVFFVLSLLIVLAWAIEYHWRDKEPSVCAVCIPTDTSIEGINTYEGFTPFFGPIEKASADARAFLLVNGWRSTVYMDEFLHVCLPLKTKLVVSHARRYKEQICERDRNLRLRGML